MTQNLLYQATCVCRHFELRVKVTGNLALQCKIDCHGGVGVKEARSSRTAPITRDSSRIDSLKLLVARPKLPPLSRDRCSNTPVALCFSRGIADYRCYTPTSFLNKNGLLQSNDRPNRGASQKKLASEAYRAIGGFAQNSIADRAIGRHLGGALKGMDGL